MSHCGPAFRPHHTESALNWVVFPMPGAFKAAA
jgi:hypothetical protein